MMPMIGIALIAFGLSIIGGIIGCLIHESWRRGRRS